jgi:serine protease Do
MRRNTVAWAALVVSTVALIGSQNWSRTVPAGPQMPQEGLEEAKKLSRAFEAVADFVSPSVVQISVQRVPEIRREGNNGRPPRGEGAPREMTPEEMEEFMERFRRFFPEGGPGIPEDFFRFEPQQMPIEGTGSGFIYDDQGHILTNNHVVEGAGEGDILVSFSDGSTAQATIVGLDPATDVAVIKVDPAELRNEPRPAQIGTSEDLHVGQWVLAIGSPFGLSQTVTAGIISATNRQAVGILDPREGYEDFIQTDAAINPGNSGGPLVDIEGRVIGINSAIATRSRANAGVGFAIPIKLAAYVADALIEEGKVQRARLGVVISPLTPELAESFGIDPNLDGILVNEIAPGSPADKAGLRPGDVIVGFKGRDVRSVPGFRLEVSTSALTEGHELTYIREGQKQTAVINLAPSEEVEIAGLSRGPSRGGPGETPGVELNRFGLELQDLSADLAEQFGYEAGTQGVLVRNVAPDSPAAAQGIEAGDLITKVIKDRKPQDVTSLDDFQAMLDDSDSLAVYVQPPDAAGRFIVLKATEPDGDGEN